MYSRTSTILCAILIRIQLKILDFSNVVNDIINPNSIARMRSGFVARKAEEKSIARYVYSKIIEASEARMLDIIVKN